MQQIGTLLAQTENGFQGSAYTVVTPTMEIALWILIGLLALSSIVTVAYLVPMLLQMKRTLDEAERAAKKLNEDILPSVEQMVKDTAPTVSIVMTRVNQVTQSMDSVVTGVNSLLQFAPYLLKSGIPKTFGILSGIMSFFGRLGKKGKNKGGKHE
ncbi:MAG: DUF948 domain-containing protein [Caldisericales bacterium]|nr:DUF948 domain-containing protein [Caldisericales bacterium]